MRCGHTESWTDDRQLCEQAGVPDDVVFATRSELADDMITAARLPASAWTRRSAGDGSKGPRFYDWAWLAAVAADGDPDDDGRHSLLIRRNNTTSELAFYRCRTPRPATLAQLVRVAGVRWTVEESFQAAKGQVRAGPAPGPPLDVLAPVHHPRPGRARCPRDLRRRRPIGRPPRPNPT